MSYNCNVCKQLITQAEYLYCKSHFEGVPLCRIHQEIARKERNQSKAAGTKSLDDVIYSSRVLNNSDSSSLQNEMKLEVLLKDPRAIKIAKGIPIGSINEVIEKYIILGDMVTCYASISANKETVEEFFSPLKNDLDTIREQLRLIVPSMSNPTRKGKVTVDTVFENLKEHFMDDSFEDVSGIGKYTDILATTADSKTSVLIELKDYKDTVSSAEIEKFWRDIERRGAKYGLFISMRSGIYKCSSCITVKTEMNKTAVFVNNSELNWSGHLFAYYVIRKIAEVESIKRKELSEEKVGEIITIINQRITSLRRNIDSIDKIDDIAGNLQSTCNKKLDELISFSYTLKKNMSEEINEILAELEKI
jgi:hypothetical protein